MNCRCKRFRPETEPQAAWNHGAARDSCWQMKLLVWKFGFRMTSGQVSQLGVQKGLGPITDRDVRGLKRSFKSPTSFGDRCSSSRCRFFGFGSFEVLCRSMPRPCSKLVGLTPQASLTTPHRQSAMARWWLALAFAGVAAGEDDAFPSVHALIGRVVGQDAGQKFRLEELTADSEGREQMSLRSDGKQVVVGGTSPIAAASAFNWYLNEFLNTTYDWSTYQVILPETFPLPATVRKPRLVEWSYHLNVCTYGYSLAFVDWEYWQKHIDWMAMQGINLPLAFIGQERVLQLAFARFNITFEELQHFISGPAFLPWFRMGNLQAWGGPISEAWIEDRVQLQTQILGRMRELGMKAALPAFAGFVPPVFATKFPRANLTHSADWNRFPDPYGSVSLLEPTDPLFKQIGQAWIEEQTKLYGTDHIYQTDTYNEMNPRSTDLTYLASSSKAVIDAMEAADKDAVWLMQGLGSNGVYPKLSINQPKPKGVLCR